MTGTASRWRWIRHDGERLHDIGLNSDGSLHNPNGYQAETVRAAITAAQERRRQKRSEASRRAAQTRRSRQESRVDDVARRIADGQLLGPSDHCIVCGRGLDDPESIQRGIGSDCWQDVLSCIGTAHDR